jgi:hypothetical protein
MSKINHALCSPKFHPCFQFWLLGFPLTAQTLAACLVISGWWVISNIYKCVVLSNHKEVMLSAPKHESGNAKQLL